jgi:hypothetical protein
VRSPRYRKQGASRRPQSESIGKYERKPDGQVRAGSNRGSSAEHGEFPIEDGVPAAEYNTPGLPSRTTTILRWARAAATLRKAQQTANQSRGKGRVMDVSR